MERGFHARGTRPELAYAGVVGVRQLRPERLVEPGDHHEQGFRGVFGFIVQAAEEAVVVAFRPIDTHLEPPGHVDLHRLP